MGAEALLLSFSLLEITKIFFEKLLFNWEDIFCKKLGFILDYYFCYLVGELLLFYNGQVLNGYFSKNYKILF